MGQTFRTIGWSLKTIPRVALRAMGVSEDEPEVKQLAAGPRAAVEVPPIVEAPHAEEAAYISSEQLERDAVRLVHTLREDLGTWMHKEGQVVMRPEIDETHDVTVTAAAHDNGIAHMTKATINVTEKNGGHEGLPVARVAISAVEPTIGAQRVGAAAESTTFVEGMGIGIWNPDQTLQSVQTAFDHGDVAEIEFVRAA